MNNSAREDKISSKIDDVIGHGYKRYVKGLKAEITLWFRDKYYSDDDS